MFAQNPTLIKAHSGRTSYYNHSFNRNVRQVFCYECLGYIGTQVKYDLQDEYVF